MLLGALISVKQLTQALTKFPKHLRILDTSARRDPFAEYLEAHIPGALFFDLHECRNKTLKYDNVLPLQADFEKYAGHLGIKNDTHVVLYENNESGFYSSPRVWWTFRVFGHNSLSVLNGGFPRWVAEGQPISKEIPTVEKEVYRANFNPDLVWSYKRIEKNRKDAEFQLIDARSVTRFTGVEEEPTGIPSGHITGSLNLPFKECITNEETGKYQTMRSTEELRELFRNAGADLDKPLAATCGIGMTACTLALAAYVCGKEDVPVYDGSWQEYYDKTKTEE